MQDSAYADAIPQASPVAARKTPLLHDLVSLALKIVAVLVALAALFTFVFGLYRVSDVGMDPTMKDGDLVMYYRLDRNYVAGEVAALEYEGKTTAGRVIAVEGDEVNIDSRGLLVNGSYQQEIGIYEDTTQVSDGVTFPLTVSEGSVFLLGDKRTQSVDSRIYGCVPVSELDGKVMGQFRRRGF